MRPNAPSLALFLATAVTSRSFAGELSPKTDYFPLGEGNFWVYKADRVFDYTLRWTVAERDGDRARLDYGSYSVVLRDRGTTVDIESLVEGFVLFYRFEAGSSWEHRDSFECDDHALVKVSREVEPIVTPAGEFHDCLRIDYSGFRCFDAGTKVEWWAPGVGLVRWIQDSFVGALQVDLLEFSVENPEPSVPFRRGDSNADGSADLTDAVSILGYLFRGEDSPGCLKSADVDDSAEIDLSDAVYLLQHLFRGGEAPPEPFARCGEDPTEDNLPCGRFEVACPQ